MIFFIFSYKVQSFPFVYRPRIAFSALISLSHYTTMNYDDYTLVCGRVAELLQECLIAQKVEVLTGDSPEGTRKDNNGRPRTKRYIFIIISDGFLRQQWFMLRCRNSIAFHVIPQRLIPAAFPHATLIRGWRSEDRENDGTGNKMTKIWMGEMMSERVGGWRGPKKDKLGRRHLWTAP